jgi:hypothetical protein
MYITSLSFKANGHHDDSTKDDAAAIKEKLCTPKNEAKKEKVPDVPKRKKKSNIEKSLELVFDQFKQSAAVDFER